MGRLQIYVSCISPIYIFLRRKAEDKLLWMLRTSQEPESCSINNRGLLTIAVARQLLRSCMGSKRGRSFGCKRQHHSVLVSLAACYKKKKKRLSGFSRQQKSLLNQCWNQRNEGSSFLISEKAVLCKCLCLPGRLPIIEVHNGFTEAEQVLFFWKTYDKE